MSDSRPVGGTEDCWCRAVPGGTGITVLALLLSKPPDMRNLQNALRDLQFSFPALRSQIRLDPAASAFSFLTPAEPSLQIKVLDHDATAQVLRSSPAANSSVSPFQRIAEHELNLNAWRDVSDDPDPDPVPVLFASLYEIGEERWTVALRVHAVACDRTAAVAVLRGLLEEIGGGGEGEVVERRVGMSPAMEDLVPSGKSSKPFWSRGLDLLGYSLNSLRHANMDFVDSGAARSTQMVRLQLSEKETQRLLAACKSRKIKLCGALTAAGLIAAHSTRFSYDDQKEKYAVVTLTDSRSDLDPAPKSYHLGFYHSAILNTHDVANGDNFWELAVRSYTAFSNAKSSNKQFTDMADLNLLMCKAIENPGLTPSSSMRTSVLSMFEDPVTGDPSEKHREIGLDDFIGCSSVHGVGPSIAMLDTIRDGWLDCTCVYPWPLHSRDQMLEVVNKMKRILVADRNYA